MKTTSLKLTLLRSLTLPLIIYIVAIGSLVYYSTVREIDAVYDANLITAADVLYAIADREASEGDSKALTDLEISDQHLTANEKEMFSRQANWRYFRIWHDQTLLSSSDTDLWVGMPPFKGGFTDTVYNGDAWRIYALNVPAEHITVEIGEQVVARHYLVTSIVENLIWPFILSLPVFMLLFSRALEFGLNGLRKVTRQINARSPELMSALPTTHIPADLVPLVDAINSLLEKLSASLQREQQLADHAAHELRTPLTALKLQAQMARRATTSEDREESLDALLAGVDRTSHIVDQLLALARIKNQIYPLEMMDITHAAQEAVEALRPLLDQHKTHVEFSAKTTLMAKANPHLLGMLLTNIVDNAVKYTPAGGVIHIGGYLAERRIVLEVTDEGPGIPEAQRERVFERFYRIAGSIVSGSGMGLAIARQCAECMAGDISLFTPENGTGLGVRISLPAS